MTYTMTDIDLAIEGYFLALESDWNFDLVYYVDEKEGAFLLFTEEAERRTHIDVSHFLQLADLICTVAYAPLPSHDNPMSWRNQISYQDMGYEFYRARQGYTAFENLRDYSTIWANIYEVAVTFPRIRPENTGCKGNMVSLPEVVPDFDPQGLACAFFS